MELVSLFINLFVCLCSLPRVSPRLIVNELLVQIIDKMEFYVNCKILLEVSIYNGGAFAHACYRCVTMYWQLNLLYCVCIAAFYFRCRTAGHKSVSGRSCDRPSRHRFFLVSLCLKANAQTVPNTPSCHYMLLM